jgi:4-diphosphocytidyl-2C-methyl-D-erythritol kinase
MSGSGPTFWALYGSDQAAALAAESLRALAAQERPGERWRVVATRVA